MADGDDARLRGIDGAKAIRVVTAVTTQTVREGCRRHGLRGVEAVALGRGLTAGCLLATLTKREDERLRLAVQSSGPIRSMLVDARGDGTVRGCLTSRLKGMVLPSDDRIGDSVGSGQLVLTRDLGLPNPYQGVVPLTSGEIDEDLERYLSRSEQLPSVLRCRVVLSSNGEVQRAAGVLCQTFPEADAEMLEPVRGVLLGLTDLLRQDRTPRDLMGFALLGGGFEAMAESPLRYECNCGRDRAMSVVSTLGAEDIESLATEQELTEVKCSFCGDVYNLTSEDLRELAASLRTTRS
ncbi:MAG: Hsp33 family molecular chaperone HslO [Myxococcota bacterium]